MEANLTNTRHIGLLTTSREYIGAADDLLELMREGKSEFSKRRTPLYFLVAQAIELHLKSYLLFKGLKESEVKKCGHDLVKVIELGKKNNIDLLDVTKYDQILIERLSAYHKRADTLRYRETGIFLLIVPLK